MLLVFGISALIFGAFTGLVVLAVAMLVFAAYYLYVFLRTGNLAQLAICADGIYFGLMLLLFEPNYITNQRQGVEFRLAYFAGLVFFGVVLISLALMRKLKWRGREIFELAGELVEETGNGYTARPRPVGKVEYSPTEIHAFARFCARHLIALPYATSKNITLVPVKMGDEYGRLLGLSGDYRDATWDRCSSISLSCSRKARACASLTAWTT
jgi:hypothetical protein